MRSISISVIIGMLIYAIAEATIWYVHPDSTLNSIQNALDSCASNDTVLVGPGTYYENIQWPEVYGIDLTSEYGTDSTIVDGSSVGNVITIDSCPAVDSFTTIQGFTITHGDSSPGGGIFCGDCDGPLIKDNRFIANTEEGIFCIWSSPQIINNYISQNEVGIGCYMMNVTSMISNNIITQNDGGLGLDMSSPTVDSNIINANNTYGISLSYSAPSIVRSNICNNALGGIYGFHACPTIDSCTISNNGGHGLYFGIAYYEFPEIHYSNIENNAGYGIMNTTGFLVDAEFNWWGDASGPYHPTANPGGLGDTVSADVDFDPWLTAPIGVEEVPIVSATGTACNLGATICSGPLLLPKDKKCIVFDIVGRVVDPDKMRSGIYFIEIEGELVQKIVKVR